MTLFNGEILTRSGALLMYRHVLSTFFFFANDIQDMTMDVTEIMTRQMKGVLKQPCIINAAQAVKHRLIPVTNLIIFLTILCEDRRGAAIIVLLLPCERHTIVTDNLTINLWLNKYRDFIYILEKYRI